MENPTIEKSGFVYLIQYGDADLVKIGYATSPHDRLRALQTGSPEILLLVKYWPSLPSGERLAHRALRQFKYRQEWFKIKPDGAAKIIEPVLLSHKQRTDCYTPGFKQSRVYKNRKIQRLAGYSIAESYYGVSYLKVLSRKPDRTSADNSVWPMAGYFNWKSLEASGLLRKEKKTK